MSAATTLEFLELRRLCEYVAAASWIIMVWEGITAFDDEVEFIWSLPWTAHIKWMYLFGKYMALIFQTSVFVLQVGYLGDHYLTLYYCRVYRFVEMVVSTMLMLCFDAVLLLRIYALYGFRTWSSVLATCGVFTEFVMCIISAVLTIPATVFDPGCAMNNIPKTILLFVVGTFVSQAILLWLAFRRRQHVVRARSTIACVTIRDGMMVFACFAAFLVITFAWAIHKSSVTTLMIYWIPVVTSVATTRIILNLLRTRWVENTQQFTTDIWGVYGSADSYLLSDAPFERRGA